MDNIRKYLLTVIAALGLLSAISSQSSQVKADTTAVDVGAGQPATSNANVTLTDGGLQVTASEDFTFEPRPLGSASYMTFSDPLTLEPTYTDYASAPERMVTVTNRTTSEGWTLSAQLSQFEHRADVDSAWTAFDGITSLDLNQATIYQGGLINRDTSGAPDEFVTMSQDLTNAPNAFQATETTPFVLQPATGGNPPTKPSGAADDYAPSFGPEQKIWQADPDKGYNAWSLVFDSQNAMRLEFPMANQQVGDYHALIRWIATVGIN